LHGRKAHNVLTQPLLLNHRDLSAGAHGTTPPFLGQRANAFPFRPCNPLTHGNYLNPGDLRQTLTRHARVLPKADKHFSEFVARLSLVAPAKFISQHPSA
jgi:hypothetical protein